MNDALCKAGALGVAGDAIGSLDVAPWDLKGKLAGERLWRLLGAGEPWVRAYASGLSAGGRWAGAFRHRRAARG